MKINREEVERVAGLARLELTEQEVEKMTSQLDNILGYVAKLDELNTDGTAVTTHTRQESNAFRDDAVRASLPREKSLANASKQNGETFVVPKVIN